MNMIKKCLLLLTTVLFIAYGCRKDVEPIETYYTYIDIHDYARDSLGLSINDTLSGGYYLIFDQIGQGPLPREKEKLYVYYNARLLTGKQIDAVEMYKIETDDETGEVDSTLVLPYYFNQGVSGLIAGWDSAFYHIPRGSFATFLLPAELAYGSSTGKTGKIPPNSPLRYDVELLWLKGDPGTEDGGNTESDPDGVIAKMLGLIEE